MAIINIYEEVKKIHPKYVVLIKAGTFYEALENDAYIILKDIGILSDQIDSIYQNLISSDEFYRLFKEKKLDLNDEEILIKYPTYNTDNLFKNRRIDDANKESIKNTELVPYKESFIKKILNKLKEIMIKYSSKLK